MAGADGEHSKGRLEMAIYEPGTETHYSMGELSGQTVATFDVDPETFKSNQTVCMGFEKEKQMWLSELCISELAVTQIQMKCVCNAFTSEQVGVFLDLQRTQGQAVVFPERENVLAASVENFGNSGAYGGSNVVSTIKDVKGTQYVWMLTTLLMTTLTLIGSILLVRLDAKDSGEQAVNRTAPVASAAKQNHFIDEVAKELEEPYSSVSYRQ